jgi:predicted DNA-binding transcriptional regulator AlpA
MPRSDTTREPSAKPPALATPDEVAEVLGVEAKTLANWRSRRYGPAYVKVGANVGYRWAAVDAWIKAREIKTATAV